MYWLNSSCGVLLIEFLLIICIPHNYTYYRAEVYYCYHYRIQGRVVVQDHWNVQPEQLSVYHQLWMVSHINQLVTCNNLYNTKHSLLHILCVSYLHRYITCLVEMTKFEGTRHGKLIASQMLDVTIRVKDVRPFSVKQMVRLYLSMHVSTIRVFTVYLMYFTTHGNPVCNCVYFMHLDSSVCNFVFHFIWIFHFNCVYFSPRPTYWRTVICSLVKYRRMEYVKCCMLQPGLSGSSQS